MEKAKSQELQKRRSISEEIKPNFMDKHVHANELIITQMDALEFCSTVRQEKVLQFHDVLSRKQSIAIRE